MFNRRTAIAAFALGCSAFALAAPAAQAGQECLFIPLD